MWAKRLIEKKPFKLVAMALANKMARIAFAILRSIGKFQRNRRRLISRPRLTKSLAAQESKVTKRWCAGRRIDPEAVALSAQPSALA
jgi:hypothetical protein